MNHVSKELRFLMVIHQENTSFFIHAFLMLKVTYMMMQWNHRNVMKVAQVQILILSIFDFPQYQDLFKQEAKYYILRAIR
jgi:hypothetical protein